ncbi:MAG: YqgE/AlgH family protein [Pseudomonadales bacterium]|nr:YqgE/AlgH family protein [Pseudomonadales bacterium]MCP5183416.1 YqgE/AlgH family protein [Pseudomonadales bacterium]
MTGLANRFLIATPGLAGGYFADTIIYLCQHDANGAMGLVINRLAHMSARRLARSQGLPALPEPLSVNVLEGGPVSPDRGFVLHSDEKTFESTLLITRGVALSSSEDALRAALGFESPRHVGVFLGYAGWGAGQLDAELENNAWLTAPASRSILFETPVLQRRQSLAHRLGFDPRMLAVKAGHA